MSAPVQSTFLNNLIGLVENSNPTGSGSGVVNFLSGLNLGGALGSSGSSGSSSSVLTAGLSLLGPVGTLIGTATTLIPGLDGFLNNGFDFSCLGGQAFNKTDLDRYLKENEAQYTALQNGTMTPLAFLDRIWDWREDSKIEISRYKSGCSKSLRQKLLDYQNQLYEGLDKSNITWTEGTRIDWKGATLPTRKHSYKNAMGSVPTELQGITIERFNSEIVPAIKELSLQQGFDADEKIQLAYSKLFPNGGDWHASGSVGGTSENGTDWNVDLSAGNQKPNYSLYALIGVGAFLAYKMLNKK